MTAAADQSFQTVAARIDAIEEAYEFCLAYAAQGRRGDDAGPGSEIRRFLDRALAALDGLARAAVAEFAEAGDADGAGRAFVEVLDGDADRAAAAIRLVLARPAIGSQMIDNLNASMHVRTLLTDLFLIDDGLKGGRGG